MAMQCHNYCSLLTTSQNLCHIIVITTYGNYDVSNIPQWSWEEDSNAQIWEVWVCAPVLIQQEAKRSAIGVIQGVGVHIIELVHPTTTHLLVGAVLHGSVPTSCVITGTLCTALTKQTHCACDRITNNCDNYYFGEQEANYYPCMVWVVIHTLYIQYEGVCNNCMIIVH